MSTSRMSLWAPADSEEVRIGWTYDFGQIERLSRAAYNSTGYSPTMESVEFIMVEADRRHKTIVTKKDEELARRDKQLEASAKVALKLSAENRDLRALLEFCYDTLIELNPSNYDHDDVVEANEAAIAVILAIREQLGPGHSPEP